MVIGATPPSGRNMDFDFQSPVSLPKETTLPFGLTLLFRNTIIIYADKKIFLLAFLQCGELELETTAFLV